jgi:rhodanese-related sulfurtransferase/DNA-binding transcriptional ArsR family regulator
VSHRAFKERVYGEFARIGQSVASDRRLELLDLLAQGPRNVEALASETEQPLANVSQHLQVLRRSRLVESERDGTRIRYRLADPAVLDLYMALRKVAEERLPDVSLAVQELPMRDGPAGLPRGDVEDILKSQDAFVIDVRPELEFASGHIAGAHGFPLDALPSRLSELPRDKKIIVYCRGCYCLLADEAVALLRSEGFEAERVDGGWSEWLVEKRPHEAGAEASGPPA